jgi:putative ABC transport system permease protein
MSDRPPLQRGLGRRAHTREGVAQAFAVIRGHRMRSALLMLGVAIGVATLLGMVTIVTGLSQRIREDVVSSSRPFVRIMRYVGLGGEDIDAKLRRPQLEPELIPVVGGVEGVAMVNYFIQSHSGTVLHYGKERTNFVQVFGTGDKFPYIYSYDVGEGRFFSVQEVTARARVCVLGYGPRKSLFPRLDPIGATLRIEGKPYLVIGVMEEQDSIFGSFGENFVVVPWSSFERDYPGGSGGFEDRGLTAVVGDGYTTDQVIENLTGALRQARQLRPGEPDDFEITSSETFVELIDKITGGIAMVLVVMASIGLMVGGIGVMNIMLISVTERTREIGIRMALGARRRDLLFQVLVEAGTLTGLGGVLGIGLGYLLSWGATKLLAFPFKFDPLVTLGATLFSVAIGVVFGLYPANRAARLDPIEALRSE